MQLDAQEQRDGRAWFFGAMFVALAFCVFLWKVDDGLTYSRSEKVLGQTLRDLRTAQTMLPAGVSDSRQTNLFHDLPSAEDQHDLRGSASHGAGH